MKKLKDYFLEEDNNENFHFEGEEVYADGNENEEWEAAGTERIQPSQSFRISLENTTGSTIDDVTFLDAFLNMGTTEPWGVTTGITPTYDLPGMTYIQFLNYIASNSARIRQVTTICSDSTTLRKPYKIEWYNMRGKGMYDVIRPTINTFQNQKDQIDMPVDFMLTGATKITVGSIAAGATISFEFYPSGVSKTTKGVNEGNHYSNPKTSGMVLIDAKLAHKAF